MFYIVEKHYYCEGANVRAYLKHSQQLDFDILRRDFFDTVKHHGDNSCANIDEIDEFIEWLIVEKGFERFRNDEYEYFSFDD